MYSGLMAVIFLTLFTGIFVAYCYFAMKDLPMQKWFIGSSCLGFLACFYVIFNACSTAWPDCRA